LIFDFAPFPFLFEKVLREWNILSNKANFAKPNDVVCEVIDETANARDHL